MDPQSAPAGASIQPPNGGLERQARIAPGSFRDPESRVLDAGDRILRALTEEGLADWRALAASSTYRRRSAEGTLVATEELDADAARTALVPSLSEGLPGGPIAGVLAHERIPFVSYPYEWSFGMLKDAALLQLDLLLDALDDGLTLKDASPYNVQWSGARPVFVDVGSFERLRPGEPWAGYRQFCMLYLYPLMLTAYRGVPFQPWLRGSLEGIGPGDCARLLSLRDRLRRGVLTHVSLHARLERRYGGGSGQGVRRELRASSFDAELIRSNARRLRRLVGRLRWRGGDSAWASYRQTSSYTDEDAAAKAEFVRRAIAGRDWATAWDLGCNDGAYARIAAEGARSVLAVDGDHASIERLYAELRAEGEGRILPLLVDLADPSPARGWRGAERGTLEQRGRPELVLCLALVHHLAIGANLPLRDVVAWLRDLDAAVVVELPHREDPMVQRLLGAKREGSNPDYRHEHFERLLDEAFTVRRTERLPGGSRTLYWATPG